MMLIDLRIVLENTEYQIEDKTNPKKNVAMLHLIAKHNCIFNLQSKISSLIYLKTLENVLSYNFEKEDVYILLFI